MLRQACPELDATTDKTTDETTSHSAKSPKDGDISRMASSLITHSSGIHRMDHCPLNLPRCYPVQPIAAVHPSSSQGGPGQTGQRRRAEAHARAGSGGVAGCRPSPNYELRALMPQRTKD